MTPQSPCFADIFGCQDDVDWDHQDAKETQIKYLVHPGSILLYIGTMGFDVGNLDGPSFRFSKLEPTGEKGGHKLAEYITLEASEPIFCATLRFHLALKIDSASAKNDPTLSDSWRIFAKFVLRTQPIVRTLEESGLWVRASCLSPTFHVALSNILMQ